MEFTVPGATRSCLIAGNAYNQSPVQVAVGLGNGAVELWDPASDSRDPLFRAHTSVVKQSGEDESSSDCSVSCGSITALSVVNARRVPPVVLAGTSSGTISQMYVNVEGMFNLKSGNVHRGVCTDISWCKETTHIASTGEDGVVNIFDLGDGDAAVSGESIKVLQSMRVDGSTINCVRWIDPYAVITAGNSPGKQLLLFDLRENTQMRNASAFGVQTSLTQFYSLALHPSNPNIVCTGADDGSISVWDIRKLSLLVHSEKVHDSMVSVHFKYHVCNIIIVYSITSFRYGVLACTQQVLLLC